MAPGPDERDRPPSDVQAVTGLTPRQLNDWDSRGLLPHGRQSDTSHRRFSPREIFVLGVCKEIRRRYGTPVQRLKWLQEFMLADGANHFEAAVHIFTQLGIGVWICTDLEETFILDSEMEFSMMWSDHYFGADHEKSFLFVPVNPLVNRLLACLKEPIQLPAHGKGYQIMHTVDGLSRAQTAEEIYVLELLRKQEVQRVEITNPEGKTRTIRVTTSHEVQEDWASLLSEPYMNLKITKHDGKVTHVEREVSIKPRKGGR